MGAGAGCGARYAEGPSTRMNLFTAVNAGLRTAMETDDTAVRESAQHGEHAGKKRACRKGTGMSEINCEYTLFFQQRSSVRYQLMVFGTAVVYDTRC